MSTRSLATVGAAALSLLCASGAAPSAPRLVWNVTPSAPLGLYVVRSAGRPQVGDLVAFAPEPPLADWLAAAAYAPYGALLLKQIAAGPGAAVCRRAGQVSIDGRAAAQARPIDSRSRRLPAWDGCRHLTADELLLLNPRRDSVDGRYFGPVRARGVVGIAIPLRLMPARRRRG